MLVLAFTYSKLFHNYFSEKEVIVLFYRTIVMAYSYASQAGKEASLYNEWDRMRTRAQRVICSYFFEG
jgi:hypothetical protein